MDTDGASNAPADGQNLYRPEMVIAPGGSSQPPSQQPAPEPGPTPGPVNTPQTPGPQPDPAPYQPPVYANQDDNGAITWTASEFIAHQKSGSWFGLLALAAVVIAALAWLITRDVIATGTVVIGVVLLGVYARQQPRQTSYTLDAYGLTIGNRQYRYDEFRSFMVVPEGAFLSVELMPLKRIAMTVTMFLDPQDEDRVLDMLSLYLPMEESRTNLTDSLMRRIRF